MQNKVKVRIIGREYTLGTDNSEEYTLSLAAELDARMNSMLSESGSLSGIDVAILCALDAMDDLKRASANADNIRLQLGEYVASADRARSNAESYKKEISSLKKRIEELEERLKQKSGFGLRDEQ